MDDPDPRILALQARTFVDAADASALLGLFSEMAEMLRSQGIAVPDIEGRFLALRKESLHHSLESFEKKNPALAAQIQELIDASCNNLPYDYE